MHTYMSQTWHACMSSAEQVLNLYTWTGRDQYWIMQQHACMHVARFTTGNSRFTECQNLCWVYFIGHLAKKKLFAECIRNHTRQNNGTRHTNIFAECWKKNTRQIRKKHSAKQRHSAKNHHVDIRRLVCRPLGVCRVSVSGTRQKSKFVECFPLALGKEIILPSVFFAIGK